MCASAAMLGNTFRFQSQLHLTLVSATAASSQCCTNSQQCWLVITSGFYVVSLGTSCPARGKLPPDRQGIAHLEEKRSTGSTGSFPSTASKGRQKGREHLERRYWHKDTSLKQHLSVGYKGTQEKILFEDVYSLTSKESCCVCQKLFLRDEKYLDPELKIKKDDIKNPI